MKRRIIAAVMALTLACSALAGCGKSDTSSSAAGSSAAGGDTYPTKTVTIICPWGVGGGADVIARKVAQIGEEYLGQPIIVENHTGASGTLGMADALAADADGYTMFTTTGPLFSLTPQYVPVEYELSDATLLKGMRSGSLVMLTNPDKSGVESFDDLKALGAERKIKYGTSGGPGSDQYVLATAAFKMAGIDAEAVVFESASEAINAIVSGQVDMSITTPPQYYDYEERGDIKTIATFDPTALETPFGMVPSLKELGVDVEFTGMDCFAIRADVPEEALTALRNMLDKVYADEEFISFMNEMGYPINDDDTAELEAFVTDQMEQMNRYVETISE